MAERLIAEPQFIAKLSEALKRRLPGAEVMHEHIRADRYRFVVVWPKFDAMGHPERQRLVWDVAEQELDANDVLNVGMILTLGLDDLPDADEQ
jgi:hypothetical protein